MSKAGRKNTPAPRAKARPAGDSDKSTEPSTRRAFLWKLWIALGGIAVLEYAVAAASFLRPRRPLLVDDGDSVIVAGPVDRFEPDTVAAFPRGKFYLARLADGGFLAISRECTHLGCTVPWNSREHSFVCPCHASSFDITGSVVSPPARRALDLHPVRIENGIVKVDTGKRLKRKTFDSAQATYA